MPIEIKELVIRAIVDESQRPNSPQRPDSADAATNDCFDDKMDMLIQLIKDKKER